MTYDEIITESTKQCVAIGHKVFQIMIIGESMDDHVSELLAFMSPRENAKVLDVGCGVGEVARLMHNERPDLVFTLLNNNEYQLSLCPEGMTKVLTDMHNGIFDEGSFDAIMVNYTLGFGDIVRLFDEWHEILKPMGILFIYDMEGKNDKLFDVLNYRSYSADEIIPVAEDFNFMLDKIHIEDKGYTKHFDDVLSLDTPEFAEKVRGALTGLRPVMYRFMKEK
jgi:SAM-dependent methyltransferase